MNKKGGTASNPHQVDGITSATITCDGVSKMLEEGLKLYEPYFATLKADK